MSPSPHFNFAESKPCSDPSHGDGFQADVDRALCKGPKVLRLGRGGTVYNVHASSVGIRGGGSTSTVKRSSDGKTSANKPKKVIFRPVNEDEPASKVRKQTDSNDPDKSVSTTQRIMPAALQKRPHFRTEQTRAALCCTRALISTYPVENEPTPPAALSAKGRALKALQEWEEVEKPGFECAEEASGEIDKEASGLGETKDGWMVI